MDLGIEGEYSDRERGVATAGSVTIRRWWNEAPPPAPAPHSRGVTENQWRLPRPRLERDSGFLPGLATGGRSALESGAGAAFEHA